MKLLYTIFCFLVSCTLVAQELKPIAQQIENYHKEGRKFEHYKLFEKVENPSRIEAYKETATDVSVLKLNYSQLSEIVNTKPLVIEFTFPYQNTEISVELYQENIFTDDFEAFDQDKVNLNYSAGVYYRGTVKNDPNSLVAFSFFEKSIMGVASSLDLGNIVVGKAKTSDDYLSYADHNLTSLNPFTCATDKLPQNETQEISYDGTVLPLQTMTNNCVRVYYEIAHQPYLNNGSSTTTTLNWITAIHNNISTLYTNDGILIALSDLMVWTSPDPYDGDYSQNLPLFNYNRTAFNGDLAHLVNAPRTTSVAYLNSLCSNYNHAYSGVDQYYHDVPTYSWTVTAMAHEMGHSMGSPHTHDCEWNGNWTAIDDCIGGNCGGTTPTNGGTIMSYCHMVSGVGVNLANGFGPQPSALIHNTVDSKSCLGTDCINSCFSSVTNANFSDISPTSVDVNIVDQFFTTWKYKIYQFGSNPFGWTNISNNSFNVSNLSPNTYYVLEVGNICDSGALGGKLERIFLTDGDYCLGDVFTDTGGENGNYGDNQYLVKTFYPDEDEYLTLSFSEFDLEEGYDFMSIYDGESIEAPVFSNGENLTGTTIPGSFEATNPTGAVTVKFTSDKYENGQGWKATFECTTILATNDSKLSEVKIYPNPAKSWIHVESRTTITDLKLYDMTGRLVMTKNSINNHQTSLQLDNLSIGAYFLSVSGKESSQSFKIIKE